MRRVDKTLSVSADTADRWVGAGLRKERITVVLTGVDTDRFTPADASARLATRQELGLAEDDSIVLYAGRIDREKGVDVLVRACRPLMSEQAKLHLVVVGGPSLGSDPADSKKYALELRTLAQGLPVMWLEPRKDVLPLIQTADVAVVPSLWPEPLPRGILEPLACGIPVIASRIGGNPELMRDWLSAYLVTPGDATPLSDCIASLAPWRTVDPGLGSRCRQEAERRLTLGREIDSVEAEMLAVVGQAS